MKTSIFQIEKQLTIRPYERSDEDRFVEMSMDKEVIQYMSGTSGKEEEERALLQELKQNPVYYKALQKEQSFREFLKSRLQRRQVSPTLIQSIKDKIRSNPPQ